MAVAVDAVGAVKQKAKMHMLTSSYSGNGGRVLGGKPTALQFWRWAVLLTIIGVTVAAAMWALLAGMGDYITLEEGSFFFARGGGLGVPEMVAFNEIDDSACIGKRVYMYNLPPQFNSDVLDMFCSEQKLWMQMCENYINSGFGSKIEGVMDPVEVWYRTEQYSLEVVIHERFKTYECLTNNPDMADFFFLPYYVGLDLSIYIFFSEPQMKDLLLERFVGWLLAQPTFMERQGKNHLMFLGRPIWDFTREVEHDGWGNSLLNIYELQNVTKIMIERNSQSTDFRREIAIPYPTNFHPRSDKELQLWLQKVSESKRENLACFAGAPRNATLHPKLALRDILFSQCAESDKCETLLCSKVDCPKNPHFITNLFLSSKFCFQPPGDSATRKAVFDCLVAGTIPVFFTPSTAYTQYLWHLPEDGSSYSVLINQEEVLSTQENVIAILERIPEAKIRQMQAIIHEKIIPVIVYDLPNRDPNKKAKDAFDVTLEHLFNANYRTFPSPVDGDARPSESVSPDSSEVQP